MINQLNQGRTQSEDYQEATARQRSEDRQVAEQRIMRFEQELAGTQSQLRTQQSTISQQEAHLAQLVADNHRLQETTRQTEETLIAVKIGRDQLSYQVKELTASRDEAGKRLDAAQHQLTDIRMALAVNKKEMEMLTSHLTRETDKVKSLDRERRVLLQENTQLHAEAAKNHGNAHQ